MLSCKRGLEAGIQSPGVAAGFSPRKSAPHEQGFSPGLSQVQLVAGTLTPSSATLLRKLNLGDLPAAAQFPLWVHAGGHPVEGLIRRRKAEAEMFAEKPTPRSPAA